MSTKTFVEFGFMGSIVADYESAETTSRDPLLVTLPPRAFTFRFYDITEVEVDGETLKGSRKNVSGWHYYGEVVAQEDIPSGTGHLRANAEGNGWLRLVHTRGGGWFPLDEHDVVVGP